MTRQLEPGQLPGTPDGDGLVCAECVPSVPDMSALSWCGCVEGQQCRGPCRTRVHTPDRCPFRRAWVPISISWDLVRVGMVTSGEDGKLRPVISVERESDGAGVLVVLEVPDQGYPFQRRLIQPSPDYVVPVLVPYAERAALVHLENGLGRLEVTG